MATVKVVVTALRRYWALGRCFEAGETELELDESQLAVLDAAKGGVVLEQTELGRGNPEQRSPCVLSYRVVQETPATAPAIVEPVAEVQQYEPEPEAPAED